MTYGPFEDLDDLREQAIARLGKRREFHRHVFVYLVVNATLTAIWLATTPGGFFWPMFPLAAWGIGLVFHGYDTYSPGGPSEERIAREIKRMTGQ